VKTYRIAFERIGRSQNVSPLEVTTDTIKDLELAVFRHARPHVRSTEVEVVIYSHMAGGYISCGGRNGGNFSLEQIVEPPVLDANGDSVKVSAAIEVSDAFRLFMSGRAPVSCGHYIAASEASAGFTSCERCSELNAVVGGGK
jgi:hypothetical protein